MEQEEYGKEEINWSYIEFVDNQDVLDLIEKVLYFRFRISFLSACLVHSMYQNCHVVLWEFIYGFGFNSKVGCEWLTHSI